MPNTAVEKKLREAARAAWQFECAREAALAKASSPG